MGWHTMRRAPSNVQHLLSSAYLPPAAAGAQDAFLQTLAAQAALLVPLRACLTPAQLAYGASMPSDNGAVVSCSAASDQGR